MALRLSQEALQDRELVREALPRGRTGDDEDVLAGPGEPDGFGLVRVEPIDPGRPQRLLKRLGQRRIRVRVAGAAGGDELDVDQVSAPTLVRKDRLEEAVQRLDPDAVGDRGLGRRLHARSRLTFVPEGTALKTVASPVTLPMMFTALAARGRLSVLAGVRPKKMQKAVPGGQ